MKCCKGCVYFKHKVLSDGQVNAKFGYCFADPPRFMNNSWVRPHVGAGDLACRLFDDEDVSELAWVRLVSGLSTRARNVFDRCGVGSLDDLLKLSVEDLLAVRGCGVGVIKEVKRVFGRFGWG